MWIVATVFAPTTKSEAGQRASRSEPTLRHTTEQPLLRLGVTPSLLHDNVRLSDVCERAIGLSEEEFDPGVSRDGKERTIANRAAGQ